MSKFDANLRLAKRAIAYVDSLGIVSTNVKFRPSAYSKLDTFLLHYTRSETDSADHVVTWHSDRTVERIKEQTGKDLTVDEYEGLKDQVGDVIRDSKAVHKKIVQILGSTDSTGDKKKRLKDLMKESQFDPARTPFFWHVSQTDDSDEQRIRATRRAVKFKHGNCGEKSALAATWLIEETKNTKKIFWVSARNWDHAWVVLGDLRVLTSDIVANTPISEWDESTVVTDGWTSDFYPVRYPYNFIKGTWANPFQLYVRKKVQEASKLIHVTEDVAWPPRFSAEFRLARVRKPVKENVQKKRRRQQAILVADDPEGVSNALNNEM
jgi:hypothetical protein